MTNESTVLTFFKQCISAIHTAQYIYREGEKDKEFHFQNWVKARLTETGLHYNLGRRNSFPDFRMVEFNEGYEVKGLAYPGRWASYDSNSQIPSGSHNGLTIFYIFGRYPKKPDGNSYPVWDLVICHGDFLNANHEYIHENKSIKRFGSYGDIMIRDRKMYVGPTPFALASGVAHQQTVILPENFSVTSDFKQVGLLTRKEAEKLVVSYTFTFRGNILTSDSVPNPYAGSEHTFRAWRLRSGSDEPVVMRGTSLPDTESDITNDTDDK